MFPVLASAGSEASIKDTKPKNFISGEKLECLVARTVLSWYNN